MEINETERNGEQRAADDFETLNQKGTMEALPEADERFKYRSILNGKFSAKFLTDKEIEQVSRLIKMCVMNLTVQVLDLPLKVTESDLTLFFSYCGYTENIWLHRNKEETQKGYVTFRHPYGFQAALLMDGAYVGGNPVSIKPLHCSEVTIY